MRLFAMLIGLIFPACASIGADGVQPQPSVDFTHLDRGSPSNTALAAPADFSPKPDIVTRVYRVSPEILYDTVRAVAASQPRTYPQINYDGERQAHYVTRSALWNFPDLIAVQILAAPESGPASLAQGRSRVVLWSRSIYGRSDLGVNHARLTAWIAAVDARLAATESPQ